MKCKVFSDGITLMKKAKNVSTARLQTHVFVIDEIVLLDMLAEIKRKTGRRSHHRGL